MRLIISWLITAVAIALAVWIVPGIELWSANVYLSIAILAAVLAFLNAIIRPILQFISLPITILTLGIFALVVNTVVLYIAAWLVSTSITSGAHCWLRLSSVSSQ